MSAGGAQSVITRRLIIRGRVQGVGYRAWAVAEATRLGLRGWVRNRGDGTVEALATGVVDAVAAFIRSSHQGPRYAQVDAVEEEAREDDGSIGFQWVAKV